MHHGEYDLRGSLGVNLYKFKIFFLDGPHFLQSEFLVALNLLLLDIPKFLELLENRSVLFQLARCLRQIHFNLYLPIAIFTIKLFIGKGFWGFGGVCTQTF